MGLSANEVVSDVLSMTMLNENGQDMSLLSKFFHINNTYSKRKLQNKVPCRKWDECSLAGGDHRETKVYPVKTRRPLVAIRQNPANPSLDCSTNSLDDFQL